MENRVLQLRDNISNNLLSLNRLWFVMLLILVTSNINAENPCGTVFPTGEFKDWGIGAYYIPSNTIINIWDEKDGTIVGDIRATEISLRIKINNKYEEAIMIDMRAAYLPVENCFNAEFVRLKLTSTEGTYYLSKAKLERSKCSLLSYKEILNRKLAKQKENPHFILGVNLTSNCLNLRDGPNKKSIKLLCIHSNKWMEMEYEVFLKLISIQGQWAKVEYGELHDGLDSFNDDLPEEPIPCFTEEKNTRIGWVKAFDDTGYPNIWYCTNGY